MIETSKSLRVVNRKSHQAYLSGWSWLTNHLLLKWKTFGLFQKTRYHSNNFHWMGRDKTTVMIKLCTLDDRIKKMKTYTYWYPMLKKNLKKNLFSDAPMKRMMIELCFIWVRLWPMLKFSLLSVYHPIAALNFLINYGTKPTMIKSSILIWRNLLPQVRV